MKRIILLLAVFSCVFVFLSCVQSKPAPETYKNGLKAQMYDMERKIHKLEIEVSKKTDIKKKQKKADTELKKSLETAKKDFEELQERMDQMATATAETWEGFMLGLKQGADNLNNKIEKITEVIQEK